MKWKNKQIVFEDPVIDNKDFFRLYIYCTKNEGKECSFRTKFGSWFGTLVIILFLSLFFLVTWKLVYVNDVSWLVALSPMIALASLLLFVSFWQTASINAIMGDLDSEEEAKEK